MAILQPMYVLTAENLAHALRTVTTNSAMRDKAAQLGDLISAEDGVPDAVTLIEDMLQRQKVSA